MTRYKLRTNNRKNAPAPLKQIKLITADKGSATLLFVLDSAVRSSFKTGGSSF